MSAHLMSAKVEFTAVADVANRNLMDHRGRPFRCDRITATWRAEGVESLTLWWVAVHGTAILVNGNLGRSERFVAYRTSQLGLAHQVPLNEAPEWVQEFVRSVHPERRNVS